MTRRKEKDIQYNDQKKKRRTENTMTRRKREGQAIQWPKEKGQKDKQHNDQKKGKKDK
jgi:hypothetical protein